ncbi:MAG: protein kinase domain-containing protein, partial [Gemmataceae bacterium]
MTDTRHDETVAPDPTPTSYGTVDLHARGPAEPSVAIVSPSPAGPSATIDSPGGPPGATIDIGPPDASGGTVPAPPTHAPGRPATMSPEPPAPGPVAHRIAGYEVLKELGRGAMGVVYKARHLSLNRVVALKMILSGTQAGTAERIRFQIEAEAVARLSHPNVVQLYEVGEHDGQPFFSLEFCDGGTLAGKL